MFTNNETFTTPEGFELARKLLLPDVRDFAEILTYVRPWDHETMSHRNGVVAHPELVPASAKIGDNEIGPYMSFRHGVPGHRDYSGAAVIPTQLTLDAIAPRIVTDDDRLSFEVIYHPERDRCLVIAQHNYIIGSHWLAYIDPATIPDTESD